MFVEVNDLHYAVIHPPAGALPNCGPWNDLVDDLACAFLVGQEELPRWEAWAHGRTCCVLPTSLDFLIPVKGNIRYALEHLEAQPYESAYVCFDEDELREAISTRLGTVLVGRDPLRIMPDIVADDAADAVTVLQAATNGTAWGFAAELSGSVGHGPRRQHLFILTEAPGVVPYDIGGRVQITIMGRYFSASDTRHGKHQPTYRLQRLKEMAHFGRPFVDALAMVLEITDGRQRVGCVTCVPARPARIGPPPLFEVVEQACRHAANRNGGLPFRPELLRCIRDYQPQKELSGVARRQNVQGAFSVAEGRLPEHVVLVDDIITTGSTVVECARTLIAAGTRSVTVVGLGRTQSCIPQSSSVEAPGCGRRGCPGQLTMRLNKPPRDGAFWGCSEFTEGGRCAAITSWPDGIRAYNTLNRRDAIEDWLDVPF
ncbi:MAG: hypothetical protein M0Z47_03285 [Actinomycetota bacterium]|nr:hypothetical protein [Actinomycetota bacterium]